MRNKFSKSTTKIKSVLFLFLGIAISATVNAQVIITTTSASSVNANDGQAIATVNAGVGNYTYSWVNLSTGIGAYGPTTTTSLTDTFVNAPSGTYNLLFVDNGTGSWTNDTLTITAPGGSFSYSGSMGLCGVTTTNITAYLNACSYPSQVLGTEYVLTDALGTILLNSTLFVDSVVLPPLGVGTYYLSALNYDNGCTANDTLVIANGVLGSNVLTTNIINSTLGSTSITAFGGTAPYYLCWEDPAVGPPCQTIMTWNNGDLISNLDTGIYNYTIVSSDVPSCNVSGSITIQNACSAQIANSYTSCDAEVYLDAAMIMVDPGSYSFDYQLTDGVNMIDLQIATTATTTFTNPVTSSGMYYLTATETTTGCIATDSINVVMNPITVNSTVNNITNPAVCNGSIFVNPITGQFPYTFTWDTAGVVLSTTSGINTNQTALCENTYCLTITDGNGCTYDECYDVAFLPCDVNISVFDSIPCNGGVGVIQVSIDTNNLPIGPILFTGPRYTFELFTTNPLAPVGTPQFTNNLSFIFPNLPSNNYLVSVFDASYGTYCSSDSLFLSQPDPIVIYATADSTSAPWISDGQITIDSITGGTAPYAIQWLDDALTVFANGGYVQNTLPYSNQYNGGYTINVTDTNGCLGSEVVFVHPENAKDSLRIAAFSALNPTCYGDCDGELWAQMYGVGTYSVPPFTFVWSDIATGNILKIDSLGSPWYSPLSHVATYVNRCAGGYSLMAYDYYGNSISSSLIFPTLVDPDSIYVQLGTDIIIDCGEDTLLTSIAVGGNTLNDTTLISTQTLNFNNAPIGFSDTLTPGINYLLVVSGTYQDGSGNMYDAAYDYTTLPATPNMNWVMDGNTTHRPTPDVYQGNHIYEFPFIGNGIHEFYILNSGFFGSLNFQLYEITLDTSIYTYSWTTQPPSNPFVISTTETALAYPGVNGTDYILTVEDANGCDAFDTVNVAWDLYILNFDTVSVSDVLCHGDSTGSITITADHSSGFSPYTPFIDGVATTNTTYNFPAGSYVLNIEDSVGCLSQDSVVIINQPDSLYACGIDTAIVSVLVDAFTMTFDTAFSYTTVLPTQLGLEYKIVVSGTYKDAWTPPFKDAAYQFNVTPQLAINDWGWNGLLTARPTPDVYSTTHTYEYNFIGDGNTQVFTYISPTANYSPNGGALNFELYKQVCSTTDTAYTCFGDSTGTATVYPNGGTPFITGNPYNVVWKKSGVIWGTNATVTGLPAGNFTATISDSLGCTYERNLVVVQSAAALSVDSLAQINVMCKGDSTGEIYAIVSGGFSSNYVVLMLGADTIYSAGGQLDTIQITGLPAGVYDFNVFDTIPNGQYGIYGCGQNVQITITEPQDYLTSTINLLTDVSCWGDSTGSAVANVIGGQFPYTYAWDNGETNNIATALWAGWQGITFTDANGCTLRDSIEIIHLYPEISGTVTVLQDNSCFNSCDAIATLSTVGGVLPHTYFWDIGQTSVNMPDTAFNLCAGGHDILVEDALGCRKTISFIVTEPDELFAQAIMTQPVQCYGFDDATAFGSATGGTPAYTFVWDSINGQAGQNAVALTPGVHTLYVTDSKGCTAFDTVVITEPTQLEVEIIDSMTVYSYCAGTNSGQLCAIASGGTPNYNYVWTGGQSTECAYNLIAGTYTVIVMDERNCIANATYDLDSITNTMTPAGVSMTVVDVSCFGSYDGSVTINSVSGAVAPFIYNWTPSVGSGNSISSLYAGSYAVVIEDSNGCATTVNAEVGEPNQLEYTTYNVVDANCFGACNGQIWVNVEGGTGNYYYDDTEVGDFTVPFPNPIQLVNDSLIFDLCTGLHSIYLTDDNGCEGAVVWGGSWQEFVDSGVVVIPPLVMSTNASCSNSNDGTAWIPWNPIDGAGGNSLYSYTWETSPGGIQVDTGNTTSILYPGNYVLVAHYGDSTNFGQIYSGCDASSAVFTIVGPTAINSGANPTDVLCYGDANGEIDLTPTGGTAPYSYNWDITTSIPTSNLNNEDHINLQPGTYTVTITDGNGCEITDAITVGEPDAITASISFTAPLCNNGNDGTATIIVDGGVPNPNYGYAWDNGGGNANVASGLAANVYTCSVTDDNLCQASFSVTVTEPSKIISAVEANSYFGSDALGVAYNVSCHGYTDGTAIVTNGGGVGTLTYSWSTVPAQTTNPAINLGVGNYTVTVSDANGCSDVANVTINEPDTLVANGLQSGQVSSFGFDISCYGLSDGWIELDPTGGVPSNGNLYQYEWTGPFNGQSTISSSIYNVIEGIYDVTITDVNGCKYDTSFVLTQPADTFVADVTTINYAGPVHGPASIMFIDATTTSTNDPVNHDWYWSDFDVPQSSFNSAGMTFTHLFSEIGINNVYVLVQNANSGCIDSIAFAIEVQGVPEINNVFSPNNDGINDDFTFGEFAMENVDVTFYNRWGQEVYSWTGENKAWDGRGADGQNLPEGVYFFVFKADGIDGHYYEEKGSITIIR